MNPQSRSFSDAAIYARTPLTPSQLGAPSNDPTMMRGVPGGPEGHQHPMDHAGYPAYTLPEHHANGIMHNGLPLASPQEQHMPGLPGPSYSAPPSAVSAYGPPGHYQAGIAYGSSTRRKQIRAAQVSSQRVPLQGFADS